MSSSKEIFLNWITASSAHGIPNIFRTSHTIIKSMWIIFITLSVSACSYVIFFNVSDFLNYEIATKITKITQVSALFPTVTICNVNQFANNYSLSLIEQIMRLNGLNDSFNSAAFNQFSQLNKYKQSLLYITYLTNMYVASNLNDTQRKSMSLTIEDMLISCIFGLKGCNSDDFEWYYDLLYGNCYKFNSGRNGVIRNLSKPGRHNGLMLELFVGEHPAGDMYESNSGVYVFVASDKQIPTKSSEVLASTATSTNIAINKVLSKKLGHPYNNCQNDFASFQSDEVRMIFKSPYAYNQVDCFDICFGYYLNNSCQCIHNPFIFRDVQFKVCDTISELFCSTDAYNHYLEGDINKECEAKCPLECDKVEHDAFVSQSDYPTLSYATILMQQEHVRNKLSLSNNNDAEKVNFSYLKKNILNLNVYFNSMDYTLITEVPTTSILILISNIGGTLGLFIGVSFLSIVEIFEVTIEIFYHRRQTKKNQVEALKKAAD